MQNWKTITCVNCAYRINEDCRRFPPTYWNNFYHSDTDYPSVMKIITQEISNNFFAKTQQKEIYTSACAEYKEK